MATQSKLESLPVEIIDNILSYLVHPRSRLPGLTERQSDRACPVQERQTAKDAYHLNYTAKPDTDRFALDLFSWEDLHHPFNELALTSKRLKTLTERFCAHLVAKCNKFNLPFAEAELHGPSSVYPNLSHIVYRRLWGQTAIRHCVYCNVILDSYPYRASKTPILSCLDCFYAQVYTVRELEEQFHLSRIDLAMNHIRGTAKWVLRVDIEALVLRLYGTKAFHDIGAWKGHRQLCTICTQAGTLSRIMALRSHRESQKWTVVPNTNGQIVRPVTRTSLGRTTIWPTFLRYHNDQYLYEDDDLEGGYHLRARSLNET